MLHSDANRAGFAERCRDVREALDAGEAMTLEQIADRLGLPFDVFADHLAAEIFKQAPDVEGVMVYDVKKATVQ